MSFWWAKHATRYFFKVTSHKEWPCVNQFAKLLNPGNCCFVITALTAVCHIPELVNYLLSDAHTQQCKVGGNFVFRQKKIPTQGRLSWCISAVSSENFFLPIFLKDQK